MEILDITSISLHDMLLVQAINETASISLAANVIRVAQPTASYRLNKLREMFDDPIFISINRKMQPTPFGLEMVKTFQDQITKFSDLIAPETFSPKTIRRTFTMLSRGSFLPWALGPMTNDFFHQTNFAKLSLEAVNSNLSINQQLHERSEAYSWTFDPLGAAGIRRLVTPELKIMVHYDPNFRDAPKTPEEFNNCRSLILWNSSYSLGTVDVEFAKRGYGRRQSVCRALTIEAIPQLLVGTNLIYCGTNLFADGVASELKAAPIPFKVTGLRHELRWSIAKEKDEAFAWFIDLAKHHAQQAVPTSFQVDPDESFVTLSEYEALAEKI